MGTYLRTPLNENENNELSIMTAILTLTLTLITANIIADSTRERENRTFDPPLDRRIAAIGILVASGQLKGKKSPRMEFW